MSAFTRLEGIAAPLPDTDIDTDVIFPARFLLLLERAGMGAHLFHDRRKGGGFVLDQKPFDRAVILVAGANFGCGSSREQAAWALLDRGIRCVIAPSFGPIFEANCFRNFMLPIRLPPAQHAAALAAAGRAAPFRIDLDGCTIDHGAGPVRFAIDPARRQALLNGADEIATIAARHGPAIAAFEAAQAASTPWLGLEAAAWETAA